MALSMNNNEFIFPNGNKIKFECENCNSFSDVKILNYNDKKVRAFKGVCKAIYFYNKKNKVKTFVFASANSSSDTNNPIS